MNPSLLPYTPERDVYRLLGVPSTASTEEIHAACRRLARTFHPDRNASHRATQEMQVVNVVRRAMTDPNERAQYDWERHRFHTDIGRPPVHPWQSPAAIDLEPPRVSPARRYLQATLVGVRATLAGLLPPRCRGCRGVTDGIDAYCTGCGTPLLTGG